MHGGISKEWFAPNWIVPMSRRPALVALLTSAAASSERLLGGVGTERGSTQAVGCATTTAETRHYLHECAFEAVSADRRQSP
jgi:hypothetical protein